MAPRPALTRVCERPDPASWADDELITLAEATRLFFPRGPLTIGGLRTAIARRELHGITLNNRIYTTPGAIRHLTRLEVKVLPAAATRRPAEGLAEDRRHPGARDRC